MSPHDGSAASLAGMASGTYVAPGLQAYRAALLVLVSLTTYLYLPLAPGGRLLVPSFPTVALMPFLYLVARRDLSVTDKLFLPKVIFVLLLSIALSPGYSYLHEKFLSLAQFSLALAVTVMTVRLMQQLRREMLERALFILWALLLVGSIVEVAGITRGISDAFRSWAYGGMYTLYDGDLRDMSFVGWVRPKVFATEPSAVSKMFIVSINAWLLMRITGKKAATTAAATAAMFVIMGSPMYVIAGAMTLLVLVWNRNAGLRTRVATVLATIVFGLFFVTFFGDTALSTLEARIESIGATTPDGQLDIRSENVRAVIPWITLVDTWSRLPVFGVGFGGKEVVLERSDLTDTSYKVAMGANAAAQVGIYLGILGGTWFVWLILRQASHTGVERHGLLLALIFLFSMMMGGLDSFRYWGHVALLWGALAIADLTGKSSDMARGEGGFESETGLQELTHSRPTSTPPTARSAGATS